MGASQGERGRRVALFFYRQHRGCAGLARGAGVFRVAPNLGHPIDPRDFFAPSNWKRLDADDLGLGGVTPLPLTLARQPDPLLRALGKDSKTYLLHSTSLGGLGGALAVRPAAPA
jgi:hypothetical protein